MILVDTVTETDGIRDRLILRADRFTKKEGSIRRILPEFLYAASLLATSAVKSSAGSTRRDSAFVS